MSDPRDPNCRAYAVDGNDMVVGVALDYAPMPGTRFELVRATLIDQYNSSDNTIATVSVYDRGGMPVEVPVLLCWPWGGDVAGLSNSLPPGNPNRPVQHVITNGYDAAAGHKGPLAILIGGGNGIDSDVIGGLGLPNNRHVCYSLLFRERGATPPTEPGEPGTGADMAAVIAELRALRMDLREGLRLGPIA